MGQEAADVETSRVLLSSGTGRHWPDARGVWVGEPKQGEAPRFFVWVNEEHHVTIVSTTESADLRAASDTAALAAATLAGA